MNQYDNYILSIFNNIKYKFINNDKYNVIGSAGDMSIGEYINLYLYIDFNKDNVIKSKIISAKFSAIGSVMLIVAAEHFCSHISDNTVEHALEKNEPSKKDGLYILNVPDNKEHSLNFVLQSFYNAVSSISNYGCETS